MTKKTDSRPREDGVPSSKPEPSKLIRETKVTTREDLRRDTYTPSRERGTAARPA